MKGRTRKIAEIAGKIAATCEKYFAKKYMKRHKKKLIDECIVTYSMEE